MSIYDKIKGCKHQIMIISHLKIMYKAIVTMIGFHINISEKKYKYQPSGEGGTRLPPATPHHLQNPKWLPGGPKMAFVSVLSNFR